MSAMSRSYSKSFTERTPLSRHCAPKDWAKSSKTCVDSHFNPRLIGKDTTDGSGTVGGTGLRAWLCGIDSYGYDDMVENLKTASHYIGVAECKGVERTGEHGCTSFRTDQFLYHLLRQDYQ